MIGAIVGIIAVAIFVFLKNKVSDIKTESDLKSNPNDVKALLKLAEKQHADKNYSLSQSNYEKVVSLDPNNLLGNAYLGYLNYRLEGKQNEAELPLQKATLEIINIQTKNTNKRTIGIHIPFDLAAETLFRYGYILHKKGELEKAQAYKKMALRIAKVIDSDIY